MSSQALTKPIELSVLDGFALRIDERFVELPVQARRLLSVLAVGERPIPRSTLAGQLWGEYSDKKAHARLRTAAWQVRRAATSTLVTYSDALGLAPDLDVDLHRLRACVKRLAQPDTNPDGSEVDLLGRELLPAWDEDWLTMERERLRQQRLHALERLGTELTRRGMFIEAIDSAMTAVLIEPLRESAQTILVEAHLGEGNVSEALRQFHSYGDLLVRELGIDPGDRIMSVISPYLKRSPAR